MPQLSIQPLRPLLGLLLAAPLACDVAPDDSELGEPHVEDRVLYAVGDLTTGRRLNTNHVGNHWFSELSVLPGVSHEGTELVSVEYIDPYGWPMSVEIPTIEVVNGELQAMLASGGWISHADFGQTLWTIRAGSVDYELAVEVGRDIEGPLASDTPLYTFYWQEVGGNEAGWLPTCLMETEEPSITAAVYKGLDVDDVTGEMSDTDPNILYIGCTAGAVGKASLWGYRPDYGNLPGAQGTDTLDAFVASVRMIRADYCGNGQSWTLPGTGVYVKDHMGINWGQGADDEAIWGMDGALCLENPRVNLGAVTCANPEGVQMQLPSCGNNVAEDLFDSSASLFWTSIN